VGAIVHLWRGAAFTVFGRGRGVCRQPHIAVANLETSRRLPPSHRVRSKTGGERSRFFQA
jgi:hypothetical protein